MERTPLSREQAEALSTRMVEGVRNLERDLVAFVVGYGWVALSYTSFADYWRDRLVGVSLKTEAALKWVAYALWEDDHGDEDIIAALGAQLNDEQVSFLRRQFDNGSTPDGASVHVGSHVRSRPGEKNKLRLAVASAMELTDWRDAAASAGYKLEDWAVTVLRREVDKLKRGEWWEDQ